MSRALLAAVAGDAIADFNTAYSRSGERLEGPGLFRILQSAKTGAPNYVVWLEAGYKNAAGTVYYVAISASITLNDVANGYATQVVLSNILGEWETLRVNGSKTTLDADNIATLSAWFDVRRKA